MTSFFSSWTGLDYAIAVIVFLSAIFGLIRGFIKEVISLLAWLGAIFASIHFSGNVDHLLPSAIPHAITRYVVSIVLIFIVVLLAGCLLSKLIRTLFKLTGFGFFDHILGLIFGVARGLLVVTLVLVVVQASTFKSAMWATQSKIAPYYNPLVTHFLGYIPKELRTASEVISHLATLTHGLRIRNQSA